MRKLALWLALFFVAGSAAAARVECITAATIDPVTLLSGTAIRVKGGNLSADIEVYSTDDASGVVPSICGAITCAGFDAGALAEVWTKCDRKAPWLLMENTFPFSEAAKRGVDFESDCLIALKVTNTGATGSACLYLSVTNDRGLGPEDNTKTTVQDGEEKGDWAKKVP